MCTDEEELHTEAIRSEGVTHAAEVQNPDCIIKRG
jgi:hypothetical protein